MQGKSFFSNLETDWKGLYQNVILFQKAFIIFNNPSSRSCEMKSCHRQVKPAVFMRKRGKNSPDYIQGAVTMINEY